MSAARRTGASLKRQLSRKVPTISFFKHIQDVEEANMAVLLLFHYHRSGIRLLFVYECGVSARATDRKFAYCVLLPTTSNYFYGRNESVRRIR